MIAQAESTTRKRAEFPRVSCILPRGNSDYASQSQDGSQRACKSDIFSQGMSLVGVTNSNYSYLDGERLELYPGVSYIRNDKGNRFYEGCGRDTGKKKPITNFSDKSRRNMMVTMCKLERPLEFWQDFTFADDVMQGKSVKERAKFASYCLKLFKQETERADIFIDGVWKKEWVPRMSGRNCGQHIPHYHMAFSCLNERAGIQVKDFYRSLAVRLAEIWVKVTGTYEVEKALSVAKHEKSFRLIESRKQMQRYMSKYLVKGSMLVTSESIGRNWGRLGKVQLAVGDTWAVTGHEMVLFKRCLRKLARRAKGWFKICLKQRYAKFFIFIESETVRRYLEYLRVNEPYEGVPF